MQKIILILIKSLFFLKIFNFKDIFNQKNISIIQEEQY